jgi:hypothetical protein
MPPLWCERDGRRERQQPRPAVEAHLRGLAAADATVASAAFVFLLVVIHSRFLYWIYTVTVPRYLEVLRKMS